MNIFFLGASGFVGSYALRLARQRGHQVWGTCSRAPRDGLIACDLLTDNLRDVLRTLKPVQQAPSFGVLCASVRQIDQCFLERDLTRKINVERTIDALKAFEEAGFTPVFLSTSYVFDGHRGYYAEGDKPGAVCEYGRQKAEVERWMLERQPGGLILRLDKIVGGSPAESHLFTEWMEWLKKGRPLTCIADQIMSPTHVEDMARALLLACEHRLTGVYHTANTEYFSREELARQFCALMGINGEVSARPMSSFTFADPRPLKTYLDSSRFIRETGMRFTSMRETILEFKRQAAV